MVAALQVVRIKELVVSEQVDDNEPCRERHRECGRADDNEVGRQVLAVRARLELLQERPLAARLDPGADLDERREKHPPFFYCCV